MRLFHRFGNLAVLAALSALPGVSARAAVLSGKVTDSNQAPLEKVQVVIPSLQKAAETGADGTFKLEGLRPGAYVVQFSRLGYDAQTRTVTLSGPEVSSSLDITLSVSPLAAAPITITAAPEARDTLTTPASVSVVQGRELDRRRAQSVISSIQDEPGVNMIAEGPTVVKPEIRGLNSQDIVIVQDGVRSEALQWGSEHAPEIDAMGTDRIEVMRGANSLLYGSDALGGVISVSHPDLPNAKLGDGPLAGRLTTDVESVNRSAGEGVLLSGAQGDWGWRANLSQRDAGNFRTANQGFVPNTGETEIGGDGAFGVRKDWGSLAFDYGRFDKRVEIQNPSGPFPAPLDDLEFQVLHHDKGSVRANFLTDPARLELIAGYDRANRSEYDSPTAPDQIAHLHWIQSNYTMDAKAHLAPMGPFQGTLGVSGLRRWEQSIGSAHLTPGYGEDSIGEYLYEELALGRFTFTFGARGDQSHYQVGQDSQIGIDPDAGTGLNDPHPVAKQALNYSAISGAVGGVYRISDPMAFAVNVGRGYRNPVPFELFAFGVHEGAGVFQMGNPGLQPETSLDTDASLRWSSGRLKAEAGVFRNYIHNYIYGTFTNLTDPSGGGLPVVEETQNNATIQGADFVVTGAPTDWLTLRSGGNLVRGYNDAYNDPTLPNHNIPHVPADNLRVGAEVHDRRLWGLANPYFGGDVRFTKAQRRTGPEEIPTPGYALVGIKTGAEFAAMGNKVTLDAGVDNLFNKGYIDFNSILKEFNIENPGRNVYVKASLSFGG